MANIRDVARLAKVAPSTVSKVLSNAPYVNTQTKKRVLEAVSALHYTPSLAARSLSRHPMFVLGLVIPYDPDYLFGDPFLLEVIRGIERIASEHDYNVLLSTATPHAPQSAYTRLIKTGYLDGVVVIETLNGKEYHPPKYNPNENENEENTQVAHSPMPRVSIGYSLKTASYNRVCNDNYRGAFEVITYLLKLGHQRIGIISGPDKLISATEERLRGARDAMTAYGLQLDPSLLSFGDFTLESGYRASQPLLQANPRPSALFVMNDQMAVGAMRYASELGLKIPSELSITGFDDVCVGRLSEPALTTIRQPSVELGQIAAQRLFELINGNLTHFEPIVLPVELIVRGTTSPWIV